MDDYFLHIGYLRQAYHIFCCDTLEGCYEGLIKTINNKWSSKKICGMVRSSEGPHLEEIWENEITIIGDGGIFAPVFNATIAKQKTGLHASFGGFDIVARPYEIAVTGGVTIKHSDSLTEEMMREWSRPLKGSTRGEWDYRYVFVETDRGKPYVFETHIIFPHEITNRMAAKDYHEWLHNIGKCFLECECREFELP